MTIGVAKAVSPAASARLRQTVLAGLLGRGIQLSRTPAMHEAEGAAQGFNYIYRLFDADQMGAEVTVGEVLRAAELCGFAGLNVTYPYKVEILTHLDVPSPAAEAVGAVNTVVLRNGKRYGHNTDLWGFAESFRRHMAGAAAERVLLVGAGGAGAAVAHALVECGAQAIRILDKDVARARALATRIADASRDITASVVAEAAEVDIDGLDGVVNATPVGMAAVPGTPIPAALLQPRLWVADIVYFPLETEFLRRARQAGCRVLPGSGMAIFQAARAFEHFTGQKPEAERMEAAFNTFDRPATG